MRKRAGSPRQNKGERSLIIRVTAVFVFILFVLAFSSIYIVRAAKDSDYFRVREVVVRCVNSEAPVSLDASYLKGRNIFDLSLDKEALYIKNSFQDLSRVSLIRVFPDRIFVDLVKRKAAAYVKLYRYFAIDEEGVIFNIADGGMDGNLPVIVGLDRVIFGPKPGKQYLSKEVNFCLYAIKAVKNDRILKGYNISKIDLTQGASALIFLRPVQESQIEPVEVKLSIGNVKEKASVLSNLLLASKGDILRIKYIDLRFKDPLIKYKDAK